MNKTITLIIGIFAVINLIYSFFGNSEYSNIFGFEVNIWIYRLIWGILAIGILYGYSKKRNSVK